MKLIGMFVLAGMIIPIIFSFIWLLLEKSDYWYKASEIVMSFQLLLWPSSIMFPGSPTWEENFCSNLKILAVSLAVNTLYYIILGSLVWLGLNRQQWILCGAGGLVISIWYKLMKL